eukprot:3941956-Rhodomonas_salina.2
MDHTLGQYRTSHSERVGCTWPCKPRNCDTYRMLRTRSVPQVDSTLGQYRTVYSAIRTRCQYRASHSTRIGWPSPI